MPVTTVPVVATGTEVAEEDALIGLASQPPEPTRTSAGSKRLRSYAVAATPGSSIATSHHHIVSKHGYTGHNSASRTIARCDSTRGCRCDDIISGQVLFNQREDLLVCHRHDDKVRQMWGGPEL